MATYVYVVELQFITCSLSNYFKAKCKAYYAESFVAIISAKIAAIIENKILYLTVTRHMMHGPCGYLNLNNVCMKKVSTCINGYPKPFFSQTSKGKNCYQKYKRCNDGRKNRIRGIDLDNQWVVPYNPYLLTKFNFHINVEICSTIKAIKYLYKYIYKGHD